MMMTMMMTIIISIIILNRMKHCHLVTMTWSFRGANVWIWEQKGWENNVCNVNERMEESIQSSFSGTVGVIVMMFVKTKTKKTNSRKDTWMIRRRPVEARGTKHAGQNSHPEVWKTLRGLRTSSEVNPSSQHSCPLKRPLFPLERVPTFWPLADCCWRQWPCKLGDDPEGENLAEAPDLQDWGGSGEGPHPPREREALSGDEELAVQAAKPRGLALSSELGSFLFVSSAVAQRVSGEGSRECTWGRPFSPKACVFQFHASTFQEGLLRTLSRAPLSFWKLLQDSRWELICIAVSSECLWNIMCILCVQARELTPPCLC